MTPTCSKPISCKLYGSVWVETTHHRCNTFRAQEKAPATFLFSFSRLVRCHPGRPIWATPRRGSSSSKNWERGSENPHVFHINPINHKIQAYIFIFDMHLLTFCILLRLVIVRSFVIVRCRLRVPNCSQFSGIAVDTSGQAISLVHQQKVLRERWPGPESDGAPPQVAGEKPT